MILEVLYSDVAYDFVIGQVINDSRHSYVCVYIPDLCKGSDWIASLDTFYISDPDNACLLYIDRERVEIDKLPHLLPIIGNAGAIWDVIHMKETNVTMTCHQKNVRHLLESIAKQYGKQIRWSKDACQGSYLVPKAFSTNSFKLAKMLLSLLPTHLIYTNIEYIDATWMNNCTYCKDPPLQTRFFKILKHF